MIVNARLRRLLALAGLVCPSLALALGNTGVARFCIPELGPLPQFEKAVPVPVGCQLVDCCPGCPGTGPLDWRVSVDGKVIRAAELRFEGLAAGELSRLKITGNARLDGERILLAPGQSRISGLPDKLGGKATVGSLRPIAGADARKRMRSQLASGKTLQVEDHITVQQFRGPFPVNRFRWTHVIKPCPGPIKPVPPRPDKLTVQDIVGSDEVIVMMDTRVNLSKPPTKAGSPKGSLSICRNDWLFASSGLTTFSNLPSRGGCNSEIVIFGANNAMLLDSPVSTWTNNTGDSHVSKLGPLLSVPVTVWIADSSLEARAHDEMNHANELYRRNRVGIEFVPTYENVWQRPDAATGIQLIGNGIGGTTNNPFCTDIESLKQSAFFIDKVLNVYYVTRNLYGRNCSIKQTPTNCAGTGTVTGDGNITYIGSQVSLMALAHELGHAFGLRPGPCGGHTTTSPGVNLPGFDDYNIMRGDSFDLADHFTLGQVFRMNTQDDQWEGTMLIKNGLRPGPGRQCPPLQSSATCPALAKDWTAP